MNSVEEFYRERLLYQLTRRGESAERAIRSYEELVEQPGELQSTALSDICALLGELEVLVSAAEPDGGKIHGTLDQLCNRFEEHTDRAQTFMQSLCRAIDLHGEDEDVLLVYKERLIEYLERFLQHLMVSSEEIADAIERLEAAGVRGLFEVAARRQIADRLDESPELLAEALDEWSARWDGLRRWFFGGPGEESQAKVLRARARAAIPTLLQAIGALNERRVRRTDRYADLRTLARWFAQAPTERDAHRLWRVAFCLTSARHLRVNDDTRAAWEEQRVSPRTSWAEAPALQVAPRLRATGRTKRRGRKRAAVDRSEARAALARRAAEMNRQIEAARRRLATGRRLRLSEIGALDPIPFQLFIELLGDALAKRAAGDARVETTSADGSIGIVLEPIADAPAAVIETPTGRLRGPDCWVTLTDLHAAPASREEVGG